MFVFVPCVELNTSGCYTRACSYSLIRGGRGKWLELIHCSDLTLIFLTQAFRFFSHLHASLSSINFPSTWELFLYYFLALFVLFLLNINLILGDYICFPQLNLEFL